MERKSGEVGGASTGVGVGEGRSLTSWRKGRLGDHCQQGAPGEKSWEQGASSPCHFLTGKQLGVRAWAQWAHTCWA